MLLEGSDTQPYSSSGFLWRRFQQHWSWLYSAEPNKAHTTIKKYQEFQELWVNIVRDVSEKWLLLRVILQETTVSFSPNNSAPTQPSIAGGSSGLCLGSGCHSSGAVLQSHSCYSCSVGTRCLTQVHLGCRVSWFDSFATERQMARLCCQVAARNLT